MAAFQDTREQTEKKVMVNLLSEIEKNPFFTRRGLTTELNIALGLMNQYLKKSITKGWVRLSQASPRRISYFLTPEGFKEKSYMVKDYLESSMTFFRDARAQCEEVLECCNLHGWSRIALVGEGDLADMTMLVASHYKFVIDIVPIDFDVEKYDVVIITDVMNPQATYDAVKYQVEEERLLTLKLLHISKVAP